MTKCFQELVAGIGYREGIVANTQEHKDQTKKTRKLRAGIQVSSLTYELSPFPQWRPDNVPGVNCVLLYCGSGD